MTERIVSVPARLTAENGAKAALIGEFIESVEIPCPDCAGDECEHCEGYGRVAVEFLVSWTIIKNIYAAAIAHFENVGGAA